MGRVLSRCVNRTEMSFSAVDGMITVLSEELNERDVYKRQDKDRSADSISNRQLPDW